MDNKKIRQIPEKEPGFFYGYIVVVAAFFIMLVGYGLFNIYGVFLKPLLTEFGWTRAITSGAFSVAMIVMGILAIVTGGLTDRFGPRIVLTACGCFLGAGFLLMSQVSSIWQLYLFFGVIVGIGASGIWVPLLSTVARWFVKRRGMMTGIVLAGMGIGTLVAPLVVSRLIAAYDWRVSYIILGIAVLVVVVLAAQFLKRPPREIEQLPRGENEAGEQEVRPEADGLSLREAAHTRQFWLMMALFFSLGFGLFSIVVHIVPHTIELGVNPINAANVLSAFGGMAVLGNFVLGSLGDRIGSRHIFIIGFIMWMVAFAWLLQAGQMWMLYIFAVILGFAEGGMGPAGSPLVADYFGLKSHGLIFGVVDIGFPIGAAVGPFVTGYIFDITGSYQMAFQICGAASVISLILAVTLGPAARLRVKS